jgi:hypothetical protein
MTKTPHNFDETTNHDLPGEVNDDFSWILPDGETIEDHIPDFYEENDAPDFDEESMGADGDFYDDEDDRWSDSDSLASCGWGEDEAYGCWE